MSLTAGKMKSLTMGAATIGNLTLRLRLLLFIGILTIPSISISAQNVLTTNMFPEIPLPSMSSIPAQPAALSSQPPAVQPTTTLPPLSQSQTQVTSPSASASAVIANTLVAETSPSPSPISPVLLGNIFVFPSPLPSGIARTASGKPIPCSPKNVKLNPTTHKLISECVETSFCAQPPDAPANATGLGMCFPRVCTRDEFPFGYGTFGGGVGRKKGAITIPIPPMCPRGTFCPDNGSGCMGLVQVGGRCELARDEQCGPLPPNPNVKPQDNKAICLNNICTPATQQLGESCRIENTTYVSDIIKGVAGGGQFTSFVMKHDCQSPELFCDPISLSQYPTSIGQGTCQKAKDLTKSCKFDTECLSNNCAAPANICAPAVDKAYKIQLWQWFATVLFIVLLLASGMILLAFVHRRHRYARYQELQEYYHEQMTLRRSILALHAAAVSEKPPGNSTDILTAKHREAEFRAFRPTEIVSPNLWA